MEAFVQRALVIAANPYDFTSDKGESLQGVKIDFLLTDNLNPCQDGNLRGIKPNNDSLRLDKLPKLKAVPGIYDLSFAMASGRNGKPQLKIRDVAFVSQIEMMYDEKAAEAF